MNRRVFLVVLICMALMLGGCQLAKEETAAAQPDRLAGVLVTEDYLDLFDFEAYLTDNAESLMGKDTMISPENSAEYSGRIWAEKVEGKYRDFVFPGVEGIKLIAYEAVDEETGDEYQASDTDEGFADVNHHFISTDAEEAVEMEGTLYIAHSPTDTRTFYINPVYQTEDGRIYVVSGSGMTSDCEGGGFSQQIEEKREVSENGEVTAERTKVKVNFEYIVPPEKVAIVEMDRENCVVNRTEFAAGDVPDSFSSEAEYIIVEFIALDGTVTREISGRADEYLHTFREVENGICIKQGTEIIWE